MSLNDAQKEAVAFFEGPCMVLAGPGSGKTLTIAKRIECLIKTYKVRPEEILVITFTKYAASEMKQRFHSVMKSRGVAVTFGTFHGIYYGILKWAYRLNQENILSDEERNLLLKQIVSEIDWSDEIGNQDADFFQELSEEIGNIKNNRWELATYHSERYGDERFRMIYQRYEKEKKKLRKIDFEDMLTMCYELFVKRPDILKQWQEKFRYILVDEFQDINQVQYDVVRMLAAPQNNLFIVGDDDQSVYGFRGAKPGIMKKFAEDFPNAKQLLLNVNYRSTAHIVNSALRVIGNNKNRYPKEIHAHQAAEQTVHVQEVRNPLEESKYIVEEVRKQMKAGIPMDEIAVLFRTAVDARVLSETLIEFQIPFQMREHLNNIYDHFTAQDMFGYFQLSQKNFERKYFLQVANRPNRFIGRDSMSEGNVSYESLRSFYCDKDWMQDRIDQLEWDMKMIENKTPFAAIQYIRKSMGYDTFLKEYAQYRQLSYAELKETLDEIQERSKDFETIPEWFEHVENYKKMLKIRQMRGRVEEGIHLITMHGAKGLEFDTVFIMAANEGVTPYKKAKIIDEIEEERRLFYVAMTRAKKKLTITYVKEKNGKDMNPSRFVNELFVVR